MSRVVPTASMGTLTRASCSRTRSRAWLLDASTASVVTPAARGAPASGGALPCGAAGAGSDAARLGWLKNQAAVPAMARARTAMTAIWLLFMAASLTHRDVYL